MADHQPKILILEDALDYQKIFQVVLNDYELHIAHTIAQAESLLTAIEFDLFVLDITLPDGSGHAFCQRLRQQPKSGQKPILFVSGHSSEFNKLTAFADGADDYITKPFSGLELKARVQSKLRGWKNQSGQVITAPPLKIDVARRKAYALEDNSETPFKLTALEFDLLAYLCERPEVVRTRQAMLENVWGQNISVTDRTVDVHIHNLRKKLGPYGACIEAVAGHGYCFKPLRLTSAS